VHEPVGLEEADQMPASTQIFGERLRDIVELVEDGRRRCPPS